ncbi:MAG: DUF2189 domain-containing protein [Alphaproteobacteria bacterium]|nr:DUF2189 domain-containing protein [Alphaproteobacteria bacterium]MBO6629250.1 DUF2189 domain-containing protein [Alphaproteobacteria bacterium]MDF1626675.1 DUF2189 domain-containing protein [Parvibaculaceae bacterium]
MAIATPNPSENSVRSEKPQKKYGGAKDIHVLTVSLDAPWNWISAGWRDMWAMPGVSLSYGILFFLISVSLAGALFVAGLSSLVLALGAGFMLVGPMLAVGLYEASRRLERQNPVSFRDVLFVETAAPMQLAFLGGLLMLVLLGWIRIASLLFALFFGLNGFPPLADFLPTLMFTGHGLGLVVVGTIIGAVIAYAVFAISVISVPLLMDRDMDAVSAVIVSIKAVTENARPMLLWAWIIALVMALGMATFFVGMIIAFPLIGHATWHAYRSLVKH